MTTLRILVTGGGSAGHISPALAIIGAIQELAVGADWRPEFRYIGGLRGLEKGQVEAAGIPFVGVETGKLRRYFSLENFTDLLRIPTGIAQSRREVARFHPHVALSTGGYVAVPPVMAAWGLRVPVVIHEQTVQIGLANRITANFATKIGLSYEGALAELNPAQRAKAFVAGNPVRPIIFDGDKAEAIRWAGFAPQDDALPTIYITGGSQGARIINRAIESVLPQLLESCRVVHQCGQQPAGGEQDYDRLQATAAALPEALRRRYHCVKFIGEEIKHVFALADLVVGRSGAGTVNEVCALGKAALFVPLVPTGGDEQTRNAQAVEKIGGAVIVPQAGLDGPCLLCAIDELLKQPERLRSMGCAALTLAKPNAARDMAAVVVELGLGLSPGS